MGHLATERPGQIKKKGLYLGKIENLGTAKTIIA
tara:strand:+ start:1542 stop:1643 length:102 start_codon:yes stop_codon:yes gene_type:complete